MSSQLAIISDTSLALADERGAYYDAQSRTTNTKRAYQNDWRIFTAWCAERSVSSLPATPATVAAYVTHCADNGRKVATITRYLASISVAHQLAGLEPPTRTEQVRTRLKGVKRVNGTRQTQKAAATVEVLRAWVAPLGKAQADTRDRALILVGFAGAFRRSELVGLDVADLQWVGSGLIITLRHSKTDQDGQGREIGIPYGKHRATCPVRALRAWLAAAGITEGAIFRAVDRHGNVKPGRLSGHAVAAIVQRLADATGFDAATFGGHSLRAGLATSAAAAGTDEATIMKQTGHKSVQMVRRYIRKGELFTKNAAGQVGL